MKQELELVQTVSVPESLGWLRDSFHALLTATAAWHAQIDDALEKCQVNVKISQERKCTQQRKMCANFYYIL